jgi:hypothetical protein
MGEQQQQPQIHIHNYNTATAVAAANVDPQKNCLGCAIAIALFAAIPLVAMMFCGGCLASLSPPDVEPVKPAPAAPEPKPAPKPPVAARVVEEPAVKPEPIIAPTLPARSMRTWKSANGTFTVEAEFVRLKNGVVTLRKADDSKIDVEQGRLSAEDKAWIESYRPANKF